jgi:hypothetical protein
MSSLKKSALSRSGAEWAQRFREQAKKEKGEGGEPRFDSATLTQSVQSIVQIPHELPKVAEKLARKGIDADYFAGLKELEKELSAAEKGAPPDLRRVELVSPTDKETLAQALDYLSHLRKAVGAAALAAGNADDARQLGRGSKLSHSLSSVLEGIQLFLAGAPSRKDLIEDAGIDREQLDVLAGYVPKLQAILGEKGRRQQGKDELVQQIALAGLAVESALHVFRARATSALADDALQLASALKRLPRSPERRSKAPAAPPPAQSVAAAKSA